MLKYLSVIFLFILNQKSRRTVWSIFSSFIFTARSELRYSFDAIKNSLQQERRRKEKNSRRIFLAKWWD